MLASSDGRVWQLPLDSFSDFDRHRENDLDLGPGSIVTTTAAGGILALAVNASQVLISEPGSRLILRTRHELAHQSSARAV